jgi:hypothetical protein
MRPNVPLEMTAGQLPQPFVARVIQCFLVIIDCFVEGLVCVREKGLNFIRQKSFLAIYLSSGANHVERSGFCKRKKRGFKWRSRLKPAHSRCSFVRTFQMRQARSRAKDDLLWSGLSVRRPLPIHPGPFRRSWRDDAVHFSQNAILGVVVECRCSVGGGRSNAGELIHYRDTSSLSSWRVLSDGQLN